MSFRPFIAILLLINYLMVAGAGCVNRPEDPRERVLVQTVSSQPGGEPYQECLYLRMDSLDLFLADALATRYRQTAKSTQHYHFSVVNGVDAHALPPAYLAALRDYSPTFHVHFRLRISRGRRHQPVLVRAPGRDKIYP